MRSVWKTGNSGKRMWVPLGYCWWNTGVYYEDKIKIWFREISREDWKNEQKLTPCHSVHSDFIKPLKQIVIWQEEQRNINEGYKSIFVDDVSVNDL